MSFRLLDVRRWCVTSAKLVLKSFLPKATVYLDSKTIGNLSVVLKSHLSLHSLFPHLSLSVVFRMKGICQHKTTQLHQQVNKAFTFLSAEKKLHPSWWPMSHSAVVCGWFLYHLIQNCIMNKWMLSSLLINLCEQTFERRCCSLDTLIVFLLSYKHNSASVLFISDCVVSREWWAPAYFQLDCTQSQAQWNTAYRKCINPKTW